MPISARRFRGGRRAASFAVPVLGVLALAAGVAPSGAATTATRPPVRAAALTAAHPQFRLAAASASAPNSAPPATAPAGWQLTFEDNFNGSQLNRSAWGVYNGPGNGSPRSARNAFVSNGQLTLQTSKIGNTWTSAGVSSARVTTQTYGMYLARVRVDPGAGVRAVGLLWPAKGWPPEVDFLEFGGGAQANRSRNMLTDHWGVHAMQHAMVAGNYTGWHTVGLTWTPQALTYTLDGTVVSTMTQHVPHQPMWLGFQTGVESPSSGHAPNASTPATVGLHVDWVAVYHQG